MSAEALTKAQELLPCPFCGLAMKRFEEVGIVWWSHASWADASPAGKNMPYEERLEWVRCPAYGVRVSDSPEYTAAWNRRAALATKENSNAE